MFEYLFYQKHQNQDNMVDISTLWPCKQVFFLNVKRANYIALICKKANVAKPVLPRIPDHGWNEYGSLTWTSKIFPEEVEEILFDGEFDSNDYIDNNRESESEKDIWISPAWLSFTMYFLFKHTPFFIIIVSF